MEPRAAIAVGLRPSFFTTETPMKQNPEADRLFDPVAKPAPNLSDYEKEQTAKRDNFERLKAERLARESALTSTAL
jgi:hypothetical protein